MAGAVGFTYRLTGLGWSEGRLVVGDEEVDAVASYWSDALGDLLRAVIALGKGTSTARVSWDEEPDEYRWIFDRIDHETRVRVMKFSIDGGAIGEAPDEDGHVLLDAGCSISDLASAVARGARAVLDEWGEQGYQDKWDEHVFPSAELQELEAMAFPV